MSGAAGIASHLLLGIVAELLNAGYHFLDLLPKGRDEGKVGGMGWLRRRDQYADPDGR